MFESTTLNTILNTELEKGNTIIEETNWPPRCKRLIVLANFFKEEYSFPDLQYKVINDPHYWYAEYATEDGAECLACRYI